MPVVPTKGQGGAGEILSLSHLFTGLAEQAKPALKDVMCLVNGSPSATGLVTDAALVAANRLDVAARVFALSFEAFNAPLDHLNPALGDYWNNPTIAGRSGAFASWWETVTGANGAPIRRRSAIASFPGCWARPGARRRSPPRSRKNHCRP